MITNTKIAILKAEDVNKLKDVVDSSYINDDTVKEIINSLSNKIDEIIVEYPYVDSDYLSQHNFLYSNCFKTINRYTYRIKFFKENNFVGYITLSPSFSNGHICRMFFDPKYFLDEYSFCMKKEYEIHSCGECLKYNAFRALRQEGGASWVCGHAAIWGVNNYASQWKGYTERNIADVFRATPMIELKKNLFSDIRSSEILRALTEFGFSPVFRSNYKSNNDNKNILNEAFGYIQSGIPVILILNRFNHGVVGIGYKPFLFNKIETELPMFCPNFKQKYINANSLIEELILNDDNFFPYKKINYTLKDDETLKNSYNLNDINAIIVPLYPKLNLDYSKAEQISLNILKSNRNENDEHIVYRTFLTSSNKFRNYIRKQAEKNHDKVLSKLVSVEIPKFVWVTEISTLIEYQEEKISGFIVLDSTQFLNSDDICILYMQDGQVYVLENDTNEVIYDLKNRTLDKIKINIETI